ncbi:MAG: tripartite tricarboxylate transporter substrate-binding protein, partial [Nitrososphaerales archaeon]
YYASLPAAKEVITKTITETVTGPTVTKTITITATPTPTPSPSPSPTPTPSPTPKPEWVAEREIRLIVPYRPGGGTDVYARLVAPYWSKYIPGNPPMAIINEPAAAGVVGTTMVYKAKPDGYTVGHIIPFTMIINQLTQKVEYDVLKFYHLGSATTYYRVVCASLKTMPHVKTWKDVLDNIYKARWGTYGFGSPYHTGLIFIGKVTGLFDPEKITFVHYDSSAALMAGFERGDVDMALGSDIPILPYKDTLVRYIVYFGYERSWLCPEVPTALEIGIPKAREIIASLLDIKTFVLPPETPMHIVNTLASALEKALKDPALIEEGNKRKYPITALFMKEATEIVKMMYEQWSKQEEILKILKA